MSQVAVGPPNPKECDGRALALADFLRHHKSLKQRPGILNGKRQDFFRVKRALRALESSEYQKACNKKGSKLPKITTHAEALEAFRLLPLNRLAFRVQRMETQVALKAGLKPSKGVPVLVIQPRQEFGDDMYYVWFYEPVQIITYVYAALALVAIFAVVLFPLWPIKMRIGVWYMSMGLLGFLGVFFGIAIVRLILFSITYFVASPGLWIFPNLFEDVGFIDSFLPLYGWHGQSLLPQDKSLGKDRKKNKNELVGMEGLASLANQIGGAGNNAGHGQGAPGGPVRPLGAASPSMAMPGAQTTPGMPGASFPGQTGPLTPQQQFSLMLSQRVQMKAKEHSEKYGPPKTQQEAQKLQAKFVQEELQKIKAEVQAKTGQAGPVPVQQQQQASSAGGQSTRSSAKRIVTLEDDE